MQNLGKWEAGWDQNSAEFAIKDKNNFWDSSVHHYSKEKQTRKNMSTVWTLCQQKWTNNADYKKVFLLIRKHQPSLHILYISFQLGILLN